MSDMISILVVEDDPDSLLFLRLALAPRRRYDVTFSSVPEEAAALLRERRWDILVTDLHMPGMDGLQLAEVGRGRDPHLPVLLLTAHASVDTAVRAVRTAVTDFLTKPLRVPEVVAAIEDAVARRRSLRHRVLAVGAHPDDVEIGAGGTLSGHVRAGDEVTVLTMSRGQRGGDQDERARESRIAADRLGAELVLGDLPDTAIPDHGESVDLVESVVRRIEPDVVYVHSSNDLHQDHRATHRATLVAARRVPVVRCYQSPSSTIDFRPTSFVDIGEDLETKLKAIDAYASQTAIRDYLERELIEATARYWGHAGRTRYAEPFEVVRDSLEVRRGRG